MIAMLVGREAKSAQQGSMGEASRLEQWDRWLVGRGLGPKTRHNVMSAMSSFLGWLRKVGEIDVVPPFPWPPLREHAPRLLSAADQRRVLEAIPQPMRGIFLALALLGLRPSEAIRARAADYAPGDPGWLTIPTTKNRRVKRLPVPDELADWIDAFDADPECIGKPSKNRGTPGGCGLGFELVFFAPLLTRLTRLRRRALATGIPDERTFALAPGPASPEAPSRSPAGEANRRRVDPQARVD